MNTKTMISLNLKSISRSPLRCGLFLIGLALALLAMPGVVRGDLFSTVNLGGTFNNGASPLYQYTPQYVPPNGTPNIFASALDTPRGVAVDGAGNLYVATNKDVDDSVDPPKIQGTILKITPGGFMSTF